MSRVRTTYTFDCAAQARVFKSWLVINRNDRDYGHPAFINLREVGANCWCVEYEYDTDNEFTRGVAHGINAVRPYTIEDMMP